MTSSTITSKSTTRKTKAEPSRPAVPSAPKKAAPRKSAAATRRAASKSGAASTSAAAAPTSKLEQIIGLLQRPEGASLAELCKATGWQAHSVRGALAGALKGKGHVITSEKINDVRRYRTAVPL